MSIRTVGVVERIAVGVVAEDEGPSDPESQNIGRSYSHLFDTIDCQDDLFCIT